MDHKELIGSCVEYLINKENDSSLISQTSNFRTLVNVVNERKLEFYKLVEYLGPQLTNSSENERITGVCLLAEILCNLEANHLNSEEISYLVTFYCDRLKDHYLVIPHVIRSLVTLTSGSDLPNGCAQQIIQNLFREIQTQTYLQNVRQMIYILITNLLKIKLNELKEIEADFLLGFIQAMDGEKDPRSLLIVFKTVPFIVANFHFADLAEELFEVISCYFPIDFTPPPNNPHGITKEDLVLALRTCLASTSLFAPFCFPLLIEKLDSSVIDAKVDSLRTLASCSEVYGIEELKIYFPSIWSSIRREVLLGTSEEVESAALTTIQSIIKVASISVIKGDGKSTLDDFLDEMCKECEKYLSQPELKLMHPSAQILQAAASASDAALEKILLFVVPLLLNQFNLHPEVNKRKTILDILNNFLLACKGIVIKNNQVKTHVIAYISLCYSLLGGDCDILKQCALFAFDVMLGISDLLDESSCDLLCQHLIQIAFNQSAQNILKSCVKCLSTFSSIHPQVIEEKILPKLITTLEFDWEENGSTKYINALNMISSICSNESLFSKIIPKLIDILLNVPVNASRTKQTSELIGCLQQIISQQKVKNLQNANLKLHDLVLTLFTTANKWCKDENDVITQLSTLCSHITQLLNSSDASVLIHQLMSIFNSFESENNVTESKSSHHLFPLFTAVICSLPNDKETCDSLSSVIPYLQGVIRDSNDDKRILLATQCLASIINKYPIGDVLDEIINTMANAAESLLKKNEIRDQINGLNIYVWLSKALILRGYPKAGTYIDKIIEFLPTDNLGKYAADSVQTILTENSSVLTTKCNANVRLMYRQHFYHLTITKLINGFQDADTNEKRSKYLIAVLHQLPDLPEQVLQEEIQSLIPLLTRGLNLCDEVNLIQTTLNTFAFLIQQFPSSLTNYIVALIPHFLRVAQNGSTLVLRKTALMCLSATTSQPADLILPLKNDVIKGLEHCLDDKKRLVRQSAVVARGNWFLVGAPGGT